MNQKLSKKTTGANLGADTAHYDENIVKMMDEAEHCLCCRVKLKYITKNKRRNRGYCSLKCYYRKPPKMAYLEYEYKKSAKEVILELLNKYDNVAATAELIGVSKANFYGYLKKLGIKRIVEWR